MITGSIIVGLITVTASLFLVWRGLQSHGLSFERKAAMAATWVVIIGVLAFVIDRLVL